jgi:hypothetical protein
MPEPVIIQNRRFWPGVFTVIWAVETVVGLSFAAFGASRLGRTENGAALFIVILGVALGVAGAMMVAVCWRSARLKGPAIEMSEAGFRDFRLSPLVLLWGDLEWKVVFNGLAWSLQFDLQPEKRAVYRIGGPYRLLAAINRAFRYPEFPVLTLGTGRTAHHLAKLMEKFRTPGS